MFHNDTKGIITKVTDLKCNLNNSNHAKKTTATSFTFGGIFSDFELAWLYKDSILKVVNVSDGVTLSSWDFSKITHDLKTEIKSVIEYPVFDNSRIAIKDSQICIIVSYSSYKDSNKCSYISFCHPRTSRILHTITSKEKVTCLSLIAPRKDHSSPISGLIKLMSGALALGTKNGNLLILDIKDMFSCVRRNSYDSYQNRFSEMLIFNFKRYSENEIKDKICKLDDDGYHIAISLSDKNDSKDCDQEICALSYISQGTTLAVGFKSGIFQLWDINSLKKLYKSSSLPVSMPVVRFGFQEPCNDPQNFCYLWVLHESKNKEQSALPFAVMYGILYKRVSTVPSYGRHYKNFVHCKKRFDLDVDLERCVSGRCITSSVVSNTPSNILRHVTINDEDPSKINLFVMVFETWECNSDINSCISIIVFDMNQWYKAQMPHQCYVGYSVPFINFMLLERVSERKASVLDVRIKMDTIQQFLTFNLSEEYSYPSSLSFDTIFLFDTRIVFLRVPGAQRSVLEKIVNDGPSGLINPSKYYTECKEAGLRPCFSDSYNNVIVPSQIQQRNYILTILLENKMSSFLVRCVKEWADGSRGVSGCILPNLIQWAWECITRIKHLTDMICIPLFDYSGDDLDRENYQKLKHCCQLIQIVRDLFIFIEKNFKHYLIDDKKLKQQIDALQLVTKYFAVIIWCLDSSLLPEKVFSSTDKCVPTYMINIMQYTEQRREELRKIAMFDKYFLIEYSTIYIIDFILENNQKDEKLRMQWEQESGGMSRGHYPPITLQSLLRMFLMPDLPVDIKHFVMIYFLLDVCDYHRDEDIKEQLFSFSVVFSIDVSYFLLVQACWYLDHEKFEEATDILLTDTVTVQLQNKPDLYKTILYACVCQRQYALALRFERLIKLSSTVFADECFYITLLLQNGLVMEAYTTLKKNCFGQKTLLQHFFKVCDDLGLLKEIFKFPITPEEEREFMLYLNDSKNKDAGDIKIMFLLSRGRYVEAVDVNHNLGLVVPKFGLVGHDTTKQNSDKGRTTTRDLLVDAFSKTLPVVTNELIALCRKEKDKIYRFKEVVKPTPLSVIVHTDMSQQIPTYKSSFETVLQAAISKTAETWTKFPKSTNKFNGMDSIIKDIPFLRSNIMTPRKNITNRSFDWERVNFENKMDVDDEPPTKKLKRDNIADAIAECYSETNYDESICTAPVEVTKILHTPHVQKRLNKLLENTPESSPLTSILKNSEISRFKQPQKVGFNVPEGNKRSRKSVDCQTNIVSPVSNRIIEGIGVRKSLHMNFERSSERTTDNLVRNVESSNIEGSLNNSLSNSDGADSYYSLDSSSELVASITNFGVIQTCTPTPKRFIESMSDDDNICDNKSIMEVMSEEEIVEEKQYSSVDIVCVPTVIVENKTIYPHEKNTDNEQNIIYYEHHSTPDNDLDRASQKLEQLKEYSSNTVEDKNVFSPSVIEVTSSFSSKNFKEICDEDISPLVQKSVEEINEATTEENDDMSEKTYESDYSYSHESVEAESFGEENSIIVEEDEYEENVYDMTASVVEETVNMEYSENSKIESFSIHDVSADKEASDLEKKEVYNVESDDDIQEEKHIILENNDQQEKNTSVEILSDEGTKLMEGPPMVFYFGENSTTSIGEELLIDDSVPDTCPLDLVVAVNATTEVGVVDYESINQQTVEAKNPNSPVKTLFSVSEGKKQSNSSPIGVTEVGVVDYDSINEQIIETKNPNSPVKTLFSVSEGKKQSDSSPVGGVTHMDEPHRTLADVTCTLDLRSRVCDTTYTVGSQYDLKNLVESKIDVAENLEKECHSDDQINIVHLPDENITEPPNNVILDNLTSTPRRSLRIACRRSVDSIPDAIDNDVATKYMVSSRRSERKRSVDRIVGLRECNADDNVSIKSSNSCTESINSRIQSSCSETLIDESSDESFASKASTSKRRRSRPSTYSSMELRKSSVRRKFTPLAVIPSDEESSSFHTPHNILRSNVENESVLSTDSKYSNQSKTASVKRAKKNSSDFSDHESSISDVSSISSSVRQRKIKKLLGNETQKQTDDLLNSPTKQYTSNRRLTRNQKMMMEKKSSKEIKNKKTKK